MEITLEEIQKKFESLPEDLKWAIMGANVDDKVIEIGQKNGLNVEQMGQLSLETHMVMFGFVHPDKFEDSIAKSLGLPRDKIKAIVNDVNERILKELRDQILAMYRKPEEKKEVMEEHEEEDRIMKSAGIEIDRNVPKKPDNVATNKFLESVKIPVVHTDHSLTNITPSRSTPASSSKPTPPVPPKTITDVRATPVVPAPEPKTATYGTNKDPYRLSPDE
jgi:hypothetical protein